ncbi:phage tail protein [Streptomyces carpaticus]|uniref:phage tail protein n=1 Tax=Streptomyces TaxID=1883 RepID=UPI00220E06A4|nr:phage tail protein [Streptomyces carpaticus]
MRGAYPRLPTPHPLLELLPAVYQEQDFVRRFTGALDEVLAPILLSLDNLPAHLHPRSAPEDFLRWLAGWVAVEVDEERPVNQRRAVVASAVTRHGRRGTRAGLAAAVRIETGVEPEIEESGAAGWSPHPGGPVPGAARPWVTVRLRVADPDGFDRVGLEQVIAQEVPAHVPFRLEVLPVATATADGAADGAGDGTADGGGEGV